MEGKVELSLVEYERLKAQIDDRIKKLAPFIVKLRNERNLAKGHAIQAESLLDHYRKDNSLFVAYRVVSPAHKEYLYNRALMEDDKYLVFREIDTPKRAEKVLQLIEKFKNKPVETKAEPVIVEQISEEYKKIPKWIRKIFGCKL